MADEKKDSKKDNKKEQTLIDFLFKWMIILTTIGFIFALVSNLLNGPFILTEGGIPKTMSLYTVQPGDGWYAIARKTEEPIDNLLTNNGATLETPLYVGQKIKLHSSAWREITGKDGELYYGLLVAQASGSNLSPFCITLPPKDSFEVSCYTESTTKCLIDCFKAAKLTQINDIDYRNDFSYTLYFFSTEDSIICLR